MTETRSIHASLVARFGAGRWAGALLRGESGAGKSDLALRLMGRGWRLVADDRVVLWRSGDRLFGRAPEPLRALMEIRGRGVVRVAALDFASVDLVVDCLPPGRSTERLPEPAWVRVEDVERPLVALSALEASSTDKLDAALRLNVV